MSETRKRQSERLDQFNVSPFKYVAAELSKAVVIDNPRFIIGDNRTYGDYHNPPLQIGEQYHFYTAFVSRINESVSQRFPCICDVMDLGARK